MRLKFPLLLSILPVDLELGTSQITMCVVAAMKSRQAPGEKAQMQMAGNGCRRLISWSCPQRNSRSELLQLPLRDGFFAKQRRVHFRCFKNQA